MDTTDPDIEFDETGVCNHCRDYGGRARRNVFTGPDGEQRLRRIVGRIRERGRNRPYDCIVGLSGGVDSTYVAYLGRKLGLRPLGVHFDNGWDSEIATRNIENAARTLGIDVCTRILDWEEFRDLQMSYLRASVIDIEVATDHAITASLYDTANERGIKYILTGGNFVTEAILPAKWRYNKNDLTNLRAIHSQFGSVRLKTYPTLGLWKLLYYVYVKRIRTLPLLNYVPYIRNEVKRVLAQELGWSDYGSKHCESIFTRFYQGYILPRKFGVDKRRAHLSTLICSGQATRRTTLEAIQQEPYAEEDLRRDKQWVLHKLGLTSREFAQLMRLPIRSHLDYDNDQKWLRALGLAGAWYRILTKRPWKP